MLEVVSKTQNVCFARYSAEHRETVKFVKQVKKIRCLLTKPNLNITSFS